MTANEISLLLVDEDERYLLSIGHALVARGVTLWTARTFEIADKILATESPSYVVSELRIAGKWLVDYIKEVAARLPAERFVILTNYPSVATAVELTRRGVAGYFAKPVPPEILLDGLTTGSKKRPGSASRPEPLIRPTLDRVIWEYLSQVRVSAGSVSEASRWLGVERHSLRRMLAKRPPSR